MEKRTLKTGLIQMTCGADKPGNIQKAIFGIEDAASRGARIICLQELFATIYFCFEENYDHFTLAEPIPGPSLEILQKLAEKLQVVIIASLFEKRAQGVYHNTAAVIDAGGSLLGTYRKNHIPDDPGFYEKFYFTPGDAGYKVFKTKYATIGVMICWDQWYPEAARINSLMGAEILYYPTAIGWASSQTEETNKLQYNAWQTVQQGHSIANGIFVVSVNRAGQERDMKFWGGSFISDPFGEILCQADHHNEQFLVHEIDLSRINDSRIHWPFLRDRRIDTYAPILNRFLDQSIDE